MDDEWEEGDEVELVSFCAFPFSWQGLAMDAFTCLSSCLDAGAMLADSIAANFARAHNLHVDEVSRRDDGEKFASDILSGLEKL